MSYARWSTDDYQSDVYVYQEAINRWTTMVAADRYHFDRQALGPWPPLPQADASADDPNLLAWLDRRQALREAIRLAPLVTIGGPHDGETFSDPTPGACADRLESLRAAGYHVPQDAIDELRKEQAGG